jgi:hypothetical protein
VESEIKSCRAISLLLSPCTGSLADFRLATAQWFSKRILLGPLRLGAPRKRLHQQACTLATARRSRWRRAAADSRLIGGDRIGGDPVACVDTTWRQRGTGKIRRAGCGSRRYGETSEHNNENAGDTRHNQSTPIACHFGSPFTRSPVPNQPGSRKPPTSVCTPLPPERITRAGFGSILRSEDLDRGVSAPLNFDLSSPFLGEPRCLEGLATTTSRSPDVGSRDGRVDALSPLPWGAWRLPTHRRIDGDSEDRGRHVFRAQRRHLPHACEPRAAALESQGARRLLEVTCRRERSVGRKSYWSRDQRTVRRQSAALISEWDLRRCREASQA